MPDDTNERIGKAAMDAMDAVEDEEVLAAMLEAKVAVERWMLLLYERGMGKHQIVSTVLGMALYAAFPEDNAE